MNARRRVVIDDRITRRRRVTASTLVKSATTPPTRPATGTETVTIACKIPSGVVLSLYSWVDMQEPQQGGGTRTIKVAMERERITLKGCSLLHPTMMPGPGGTL